MIVSYTALLFPASNWCDVRIMNLKFSATDERFRHEVQDFLGKSLTEDLRHYASTMTSVYADKQTSLAWQTALRQRGWAAPAWPPEHGGCNWSASQHYIFASELAAANAPPLSPMGIEQCGPAIVGHGSDKQQNHFLPRILSGEDFWCQGYSEPHAGSDLAALSMRAVDDGDDLICSGSKIWTTHAHEANMCFCLVRTSEESRPQLGITFLLIDMTLPGISTAPIVMLSGEHIQNTMFFDEVRVSKRNVVGQIGAGWTVAKYLLEFERGGSAYGPKLRQRLNAIRQAAYKLGAAEPALLATIADAEIAVSTLEHTELRFMAAMSNGQSPGPSSSMMKILGTELSQRLTEIALELAGHYSAPFQPQHLAIGGHIDPCSTGCHPPVGPSETRVAGTRYLNDRAGTIYAGSNEIQRNILSKLLL